MTGVEKFETYLAKKYEHTKRMIEILSNSKDFDNAREVESLLREKALLSDIIHHFQLFVKDENNRGTENNV